MLSVIERTCAVTAVALLALSGAACSAPTPAPEAPHAAAAPPQPPPPPPPPAPESVHANELGKVPVLMYHRITTDPSSVYDRTPQDFRAELERLNAEGYTPITASEFADGRINIPAGRHPVVLTFDDGSTGQFTVDGNGAPAPDTAVRILLDTAAAHPEFRATATFFVFDPPFEDPGGRVTLPWLHEHGFEVGNHTLDHPNLGQVDSAEAQHEIASMQRIINAALPDVPVRSLALPLGMHPDDEALAADGSADGVTYHHDSVFLVGSNPAPSPFDADFDRQNIPRIRSQAATGEEAEYGSTQWLDELAGDPGSRYTSDGDPNRVSAPNSAADPAPGVPGVYRY
ncbi:polysaccharide deacetylase family protein [Saccharopolyspora gloriosae]|uniref:polysaccharide deacetylase family protein n=1 Tax=Saccharopolyspora gloriosae TaxID=455344 RepID=UPI001FB5EEAD|nr:polysaccharide deacetylase family protein [Saccharopolyspora gloriosae]